MESAFAWLGRLGDGLLELLPRRQIVCTTQAAVVWWFGSIPKVWGPGWYVWWPLIQEMQLIETTQQTTTVARQTVTAADGSTVGVGGWITYRVTDPKTVATLFGDHETTLRETVAGLIADSLRESGDVCSDGLKESLEANQASRGIEIIDVSLSDYFKPAYTVAKWEAE